MHTFVGDCKAEGNRLMSFCHVEKRLENTDTKSNYSHFLSTGLKVKACWMKIVVDDEFLDSFRWVGDWLGQTVRVLSNACQSAISQ